MNSFTPLTRKQRINNCLLLNSSFVDNLGIMHGKMGIAIYFFHLFRNTANRLYEDFACELVDEIYSEICSDTPCTFEDGLSGIGWGIEYLARRKFVDANTDEVLAEFDDRIIHEITYHANGDIGVLHGASGYISYFLSRFNSKRIVKSEQTDVLEKALKNSITMLNSYVVKDTLESGSSYLMNEPNKFDLVWNFTSVLWVLIDLIKSKAFETEAKQITKDILFQIEEKNFHPKLSSHRLLLGLVFERLKKHCSELVSSKSLQNFKKELLENIDRDSISSEITFNSTFLRNGTTGISLIYCHLYRLNKNSIYEVESNYWKSFGDKLPESDQGFAGFFVAKEQENKAFGLLMGLAGINFYSYGKN